MGGKSSSSSSNQTTTNTQNLNIQGAGAPVVAGSGNKQSVKYISTDQGAVKASFDAIDAVNQEQQKTLRQSNDVLAESVRRALDYSSESNREALGFADRVQDAAYSFATDNVRTEVAQGFDTLVKWSLGAASLVALAMVLKR